jgi:hypothetical protein
MRCVPFREKSEKSQQAAAGVCDIEAIHKTSARVFTHV